MLNSMLMKSTYSTYLVVYHLEQVDYFKSVFIVIIIYIEYLLKIKRRLVYYIYIMYVIYCMITHNYITHNYTIYATVLVM